MRKDLNQSFIANGATPSGVHFFGSDEEPHALIVETGEVLSLSPELARVAQGAQRLGDEQRTIALLLKHQSTRHPRVQAPKSVPLKALSLAIAQQCNLACTYCYAQHGTFGTDARAMSLKVAMAAVDLLFKDANPGDQRTLAFMGGEPLTNRSALLATVRYALEHASLIGIQVGFSLTTNGTLISDDDIKLFDSLGFTVTIGLDGIGSLNDNQRPFAGGRGSYQRVIQRIKPLLDKPNRRARVYVRATITPSTLDLSETLKTLTALGFDGVMFSPLISTPFATEEMCQKDLIAFLTELKTCGAAFEQSLAEETVIPFTNVLTQLRRIHQRHREDYHCGAGGGYLGVSANGTLAACHRFVEDELGQMGDVTDGIDAVAQADWLSSRNLNKQAECRSCWARNLCSGSCHYEVLKRGRPACDYIRDWLDYCLGLYSRTANRHPDMLSKIVKTKSP